MKYIVYQTINSVNKKIYIGVHATENPDIFDGYLGCGVYSTQLSTYKNPKTPFQYAVKKYGCKVFQRITLYTYNTAEEAYKKEAQLVDRDFINNENTYNIALGGIGGNFEVKPIYQFSDKGILIKSWDSIHEAEEYYGLCRNSLTTALQFKEKCRNYFWSRDKEINLSLYSKGDSKVAVYKYTKNGKLVIIYESILDASRKENIERTKLSVAIKSETLINDFYFSNKLYDEFSPKPRISLRNKKFYLYKLSGEFIQEFDSGKDLLAFLKSKSWNTVYRAIHIQNGIYKDYQIKLEYLGDRIPPMQNKSLAKPVNVYTKDGQFIKTCESVQQACKEFDVLKSSINRVLRGLQNTTKNYIFKWKLNDIV